MNSLLSKTDQTLKHIIRVVRREDGKLDLGFPLIFREV